jgi:hypothetical protein
MNHDRTSLTCLTSLAPTEGWERRVRERCLGALAEPRRRSAAPLRLLADAAVLAAASVYLGAVLTEALRVIAK